LCHRRGHELKHDVTRNIAEELRNEYAQKRGLHLEVLPNAFCGTQRADIFESEFSSFSRRPGVSQEAYRTFLLDLSPSLEELRKNLDKKWRNQLNAGTKNNLEVVEGSNTAAYVEFSALYEQMWQRKKFESAVSIDEFHKIQQRLPEQQKMRIFICRSEGRAVAGLVCSALGETAIYLLGATNEDGMKVKASYLLQWTAIQSAKKSGSRLYDLGGIDPVANPGVHHFKSGLSGADMSHLGAMTACDSSISAGLVKTGQVVRGQLRALQLRVRRKRLGNSSQ
jgi:lipid II:glycine glycyltransferase (peptidoglycan interpeptide bridge formation enzyme)